MSRNEILVPEEQETIVVDRLADEPISVNQAMSIVPGIEVTLAKRIIKPGSNRVMCLAAQTSVPLSDDDIASVSNLALRLSDGTNVALSLSFFNDDAASACVPLDRYVPLNRQIPLNRYYFDPYRYTVHTQAQSGSSLGFVLVATALIAAGGLYYVLNNCLNKPQHPAAPAKTALLTPAIGTHKAPPHHSKNKGATTATAAGTATGETTPNMSTGPRSTAPGASTEAGPTAANAISARSAGKAQAAAKHGASDWQSASENAHSVGRKFGLLKPRYEPSHPRYSETVHTSAPRAPKGNFLVPPPPPVMYSFPPTFDFMPRLADPPKSAVAPASAAPVKRGVADLHSSPTEPMRPPASARQRAAEPLRQNAAQQIQQIRQASAAAAATDQDAPVLGPIRVTGEKQTPFAAPVPGSEYPALERIVIPPAQQDP